MRISFNPPGKSIAKPNPPHQYPSMNTIKILIEFIQPAVPAIVAGVAYAIGVRVGWNMRGEAARVRRQNHKPFRG